MTRLASPSSKLYKNSKPLREIVGDEIHSRIFSGEFPPGFPLVERDLAEKFQVSRLPVREAMRVLQNEGLVEPLPSRGSVVTTLNRQEVNELFDIREALAEVICLGCGGMAGLKKKVSELTGAPVVDGVTAAVTVAESLVRPGLSTSKVRTYAPPRPKAIKNWPPA